jgi:hypothetical protein
MNSHKRYTSFLLPRWTLNLLLLIDWCHLYLKIEEEKALKQLRRSMVPHARPLPKFDRPFRPQRWVKKIKTVSSKVCVQRLEVDLMIVWRLLLSFTDRRRRWLARSPRTFRWTSEARGGMPSSDDHHTLLAVFFLRRPRSFPILPSICCPGLRWFFLCGVLTPL